ncbi:ankyrin repeat domain-containing protein [Sinomicrobium soli]|uniref:ankyrin repeat domain-containing protein n=1 Tax=Sinomicrobium sp. N-1-3-6 TaxID=2219864 RepID=UPI000DCB9D32|nr:ankyrin repeat domain-containing protein [Sinomicrobium sp. N-1-3-6]RAV27634.1 hypothetical protein DN748_17770 [Sinomicrobium sp. N-1-3-6]
MASFDRDAFFRILFSRDEHALLEYLKEPDGKIPAEQLDRLFQTIVQNRYWKTLEFCIENDIAEPDLFEYESFARTPVHTMLIPNLSREEDWQAYLPLFNAFLRRIEDIDEEVAGYNLLSYAIENKSPVAILKAVIDTGISMNYQSVYGVSYLYQCCQKLRMPRPDAGEVVQLLLDNGVDVNARTTAHKTALFQAVECAHIPVTRQLLEAGADVSQADTKGLTVFYIAAVHLQNAEMFKLLLEYGTPDFTRRNSDNENMLNAFLKYVQPGTSSLDILKLLLDNGASLTDTSEYYHRPKSGIDWVAEKPPELLAFLLEHDYIDVNARDDNGTTLLMKVCAYPSNHEESRAKDTYRKVKMLLKGGADPETENNEDKKAVDYAMEDQLKAKIVQVLLER